MDWRRSITNCPFSMLFVFLNSFNWDLNISYVIKGIKSNSLSDIFVMEPVDKSNTKSVKLELDKLVRSGEVIIVIMKHKWLLFPQYRAGTFPHPIHSFSRLFVRGRNTFEWSLDSNKSHFSDANRMPHPSFVFCVWSWFLCSLKESRIRRWYPNLIADSCGR